MSPASGLTKDSVSGSINSALGFISQLKEVEKEDTNIQELIFYD